MAKQTFTTGQDLTAAQMTSLQGNDYNQTVSTKTANYVLVAADAGTTIVMNSASATTITVNTALFTAGDTLRIQNIGAGACVVTAGTATVTVSGTLSIPQWGGGTLYFTSAAASIFFPNVYSLGLTSLKAQTIGSAVSSVTVSNVFSSAYENYRVVVNGVATSTNGQSFLYTQNGSAGSTYTGNVVYFNSATNAVANQNSNNWTSAIVGVNNTTKNGFTLDILGPNLAQATQIQGFSTGHTTASTSYQALSVNCDTNAAASTNFTITMSTGTMTGGTIVVYGYSNS